MKRTKKFLMTMILIFFFGISCSKLSFADTAGGSVSIESKVTFFDEDKAVTSLVEKTVAKADSGNPVKRYLPQTGETSSLILATTGFLILMWLMISRRRRGEND